MKIYEILTLIAILVGPVVAVCITLWAEKRKIKRDGQVHVLRMLLNTRHMPADPAYVAAINLIPLEFNVNSEVMSAWKKYIQVVQEVYNEPKGFEKHQNDMRTYQTKLIFEIARSLNYNLPETDIQTFSYISQGFADRDILYLDYLKATREIADTLKSQNALFNGIPEKE